MIIQDNEGARENMDTMEKPWIKKKIVNYAANQLKGKEGESVINLLHSHTKFITILESSLNVFVLRAQFNYHMDDLSTDG